MAVYLKATPEKVGEFIRSNRENWLGRLTVPNIMRKIVQQYPDHIALVEGETGKSWTYRQFDLESNRLAHGLKKLGVGKGDRVAQIHPNQPLFHTGYMAIQKIGAANVPLNPRYAAREFEYIINHSDAVALIMDEAFLPVINEIRPSLSSLKQIIVISDQPREGMITYQELLEIGSPDPVEEDVLEDDVSSLLYTSGTTGLPKGVMLSHLNCLSQAIMTMEVFGFRADDIFLDMLPYFHCQYQCFILPSFMTGLGLISLRAFDPAQCMEVITRHRATVTLFVPAMHNSYLIMPGFREKYIDGRMDSLRLHLYGGSIMPYPTIQRLREWWPGVKLQNIFGMTETCAALTSLTDEYALTKIASVGPSLSHIDLRIVDEGGKDSQVGEILAWGPTVMKGYYKNPEATAEALRGGWYHTGDIGRLDEDGFLYIVDRKKDMVVRGGENIYPAEVEKVLLEHPAVAETAVIGVPDPRLQELVKAFVVFKEGQAASEEELAEHCRKNMARYKVPQLWEIIGALPRNAMGKVLKGSLRSGGIADVHEVK